MIKEMNLGNLFNKYYKLCYGEDIDYVCRLFNQTPENLLFYNENVDFCEGDLIFVPFVNKVIHIVKPAETLKTISEKYNVSIDEIKSKNNIDIIFIGMKLYI